ncbi:MAG: M15 family metallopeptidase [Lachnospiraceae bacterium]|nr:M15 family metallopeptidase [Lachnospiraceae bacterium]
MDFSKILKPLGGIILIIVLSVVSIKLLTRSETIADYAAKNPDIAYATPELIPGDGVRGSISTPYSTNTPAPEPTSQPTPTPEPTPTPGVSPEDITKDSFYYTIITDELKARITGISYPEDDSNIAISYDDLRYLRIKYYDFDGNIQDGELICNKAIADDLADIFYELFENEYQIEKVRLIDEYNGDDTASMLDNNTSCFNYRLVENSSSLSKHALGRAIDINPFYNPYIVFGANPDGTDYISPAGSEIYIDRTADFPHKIDKDDLCCKLFKQHGFVWGGDWNSCKDYQHFQKK